MLCRSAVSHSFATPWTVDPQAPLSMGFSRQEYRSGLPFPLAGDLCNPGIQPASLVSPALVGGFFTTVLSGKSIVTEMETVKHSLPGNALERHSAQWLRGWTLSHIWLYHFKQG